MPRKWIERWRINRATKKKLGMPVKQSPSEHYIFMQDCVSQMVDEGSDPDEAQMICQLLWEEEGSLDDYL